VRSTRKKRMPNKEEGAKIATMWKLSKNGNMA
jgi:hypothetical protein